MPSGNVLKPLSANQTKSSNTLKQFVEWVWPFCGVGAYKGSIENLHENEEACVVLEKMITSLFSCSYIFANFCIFYIKIPFFHEESS